MKCLSGCSNNPSLGGQELQNKGEWKDFAVSLMKFVNNDTKLDIVLSDVYVAGKLLARVQAERRLIAIQRLQQTANDIKADRRRRSVLTLQTNEEGEKYVIVEKDVLSSSNKNDVDVLSDASYYCMYADYVYHLKLLVAQFALAKDETRFIPSSTTNDWSWECIRERYSLSSIGLDMCYLLYAQLYNGLGE